MAEGAEIDFDKLFMLNIDSILCTVNEVHGHDEVQKRGGTGCTTIICNGDEVILGHTEDAMAEIKDHVYIIHAEILSADDEDTTLEKFTTLCYAGTLMGYTMGFNSTGMIYSVNTIFPAVYTTGTPRSFIARAILGASDMEELVNVLTDKGNGIADGFSLNVCFTTNDAQGNSFYNIEVAPSRKSENASIVDVEKIETVSSYVHCNGYLRLDVPQVNDTALKYSTKRNETITRYNKPESEHIIAKILSDKSDFDYPIYNDGKESEEDVEYAMNFIRTVAVGIFDVNAKTWKVYNSPPNTETPVHTFTL